MLDVYGEDVYGQVEINIEWGGGGGAKNYSVDADAGVWAWIAILGADI